MPPTAGTHMPSTACMTWIWTMAQVHRVQSPSRTMIPTPMHTTSQTRSPARQRPYLPHFPRDLGAHHQAKRCGKATMDPTKDAVVSAHTITTIMNAGEVEGTGGVVEGEGDEVALADEKAILHPIGLMTVERRTVLLDHCRRPRPCRQQLGNITDRTIRRFPHKFHRSSALRRRIHQYSSSSSSSCHHNSTPYNRTSIRDLQRSSV